MPNPRAVAAAALLLLVAGCSSDERPTPDRDPPSSPPPSAVPPPLPEPAATGLDPIRTAARPAWTSDDLPLEERQATVVGDTMLLTGDRTQVVDLRSGRVLWRAPSPDSTATLRGTTVALSDLNDEPALVDTAEGPRVVAAYYSEECAFDCPAPAGQEPQEGLVALDARTGEIAWGGGLTSSALAGYLDPRDRDERLAVVLAAASSEVVVAGVGDFGLLYRTRPDRTLPAYAVGLDPATGKRLWVRPDVVVDAVAGDLVVGRVNDERAPYLVGLDARTGEQRWRSTDRGELTWSVSPRVVVVDDYRLIDAGTGRPLAQQPPPGIGGCASWTSGDLDVACSWDARDDPETGGRLLTLTADGTMSISEPLSPDPDALWSPVSIAGEGAVGIDSFDPLPGAVDAAARSLVPHEPDLTVVSVGDRYVVLGGGGDQYSGFDRIEVRRRR